MNNGKRVNASAPRFGKRSGILLVSLLLLLTVTIGGTLAYLIDKTEGVKNIFTPSKVTTEVTEEFDGETKTNVNVTNTGDIDAYIRVKLVTYRVNDKGEQIGGTATIPSFTPGDGWVEHNGFYYYTSPVAAGHAPAVPLIESITLQAYTDDDGGKQVIEVMAEGIQAKGTDENGVPAVELAWKVKIEPGNVIPVQ